MDDNEKRRAFITKHGMTGGDLTSRAEGTIKMMLRGRPVRVFRKLTDGYVVIQFIDERTTSVAHEDELMLTGNL